jgi:hypothetical protein
MVIRFLQLTCNFGNPAIQVGPVAFRPTIARGLALSIMFGFRLLLSNYRAISMPRTIDSYNILIYLGFYKKQNFTAIMIYDPFLTMQRNHRIKD